MFSLMKLIPLLLLSALITSTANAEARRDSGDQALKKAQYLLRQLNDEKTALQTQLAAVQKQLKDSEKEADRLKSQLAKTKNNLSKSKGNNSQLVERVRSDVQKYNTLMERYRETIRTLNMSTSDNKYLVSAVQEREDWIADCRMKNDGLYNANIDLLDKYSEVASSKSNPITGFLSVEVENEQQDYQYQLEDLQTLKFEPSIDVSEYDRSSQPQEAAASTLSTEEN